MIEKKVIEEVADLACLKLSGEKSEEFQRNFDQALDHFNTLQKVNTKGVEPMVTPHDIHPPLREDRVDQKLSREEILQNAPDIKDSLFKVPPVV